MLIHNIINIVFLYLAYISYIERQWVLRWKTGFWPTFTPKNGKYGQKYVGTVTEITLPPHKLHSGARWQILFGIDIFLEKAKLDIRCVVSARLD